MDEIVKLNEVVSPKNKEFDSLSYITMTISKATKIFSTKNQISSLFFKFCF